MTRRWGWHSFAFITAPLAVVGVWTGASCYGLSTLLVVAGAVLGLVARGLDSRRIVLVVAALVFVIGQWRGHTEWSVRTIVTPEPYSGIGTLVNDPDPTGRGTKLVIEVEGRRVEGFVYGRLARRVENSLAGERLRLEGSLRPVEESRRRRALVRHVVGRIELESLTTIRPAAKDRIAQAVNRVRRLLEHGTRPMSDADRSVVGGLLYGDDRRLSESVVGDFRRSGLAHLSAVSGQNVAFLLAALSPLLTRQSRLARTCTVAVVLTTFVLLTRAEPSVIRASLMAAIAVSTRTWGLPITSASALGAATTIGVLIDPMLVWSIGWWMSIAGCVGLVVVAPLVGRRNHKSWLRELLVTTVSAHVAVMPVSASVFGWPSAWSIPANLLAVPVAGLVMLLGLPAVVLAGVLPESLARLLCWPVAIGGRWVSGVARVFAALPSTKTIDGVVDIALLVVVIGAVGIRLTSHPYGNLPAWESSSSTAPTKSSSPKKSSG